LVIAGGALQASSGAIFRALVRAAAGPIAVFGTASAEPARVAALAVADIHNAGGRGVAVDITPENAARTASDPATLEVLRGCGGYWFEGGDQRRIVAAFAPQGRASPVLETIRARFNAGAAVGGTSAGAAMMSDPMIADGTSLEALRAGEATLERGLGFLSGALIDQHFLKRGRFARLVLGMAQAKVKLGLGVDEDTALVMPSAGPWQVIGSSSVALFEAPALFEPGRIRDVAFSLLSQGDSFDPQGRAIIVSRARPAISADEYCTPGVQFDANLSAPDALNRLAQNLASSLEASASGLVMTGSSSASFSDDAWRVVLEKTSRTQGFYGHGDGNAYTVVRVGLRLEPVRVTVAPR
jgi:cyanophycinase